jgi:hypothetical protein
MKLAIFYIVVLLLMGYAFSHDPKSAASVLLLLVWLALNVLFIYKLLVYLYRRVMKKPINSKDHSPYIRDLGLNFFTRERIIIAARFTTKVTIIGAVTALLFTVVSPSAKFSTLLSRGIFDFLILSALLGSFIWFIVGRLFKSQFKETASDLKKIMTDLSDNKQSPSDIDTSSKVQVAKKISTKEKDGALETVAKVLVAQAAFNAAVRPIVVQVNGGTVHGVVPKGTLNWEIHYTVPGNNIVQKHRISRNTTGFNHGPYQFRITWPSPI